MNSVLHLAPAVRFAFKDALRYGATVFGIVLLIILALESLFIIMPGEGGSVSGSSTIMLIFAFICGLSIRSDLRIFIQHGIGRHTVFIAELISTIVLAAIFAVTIELTTIVLQNTLGAVTNISFIELYQSIYLFDTLNQYSMSLGEHLMSMLFIFSLYCLLYMMGAFISMVYYRINKVWTIVLSVSVPLLVLAFISLAPGSSFTTLAFIMLNPGLAISAFLGLALVFTVASWIIIRHISIRAVGA